MPETTVVTSEIRPRSGMHVQHRPRKPPRGNKDGQREVLENPLTRHPRLTPPLDRVAAPRGGHLSPKPHQHRSSPARSTLTSRTSGAMNDRHSVARHSLSTHSSARAMTFTSKDFSRGSHAEAAPSRPAPPRDDRANADAGVSKPGPGGDRSSGLIGEDNGCGPGIRRPSAAAGLPDGKNKPPSRRARLATSDPRFSAPWETLQAYCRRRTCEHENHRTNLSATGSNSPGIEPTRPNNKKHNENFYTRIPPESSPSP